MKKYIIAFYSMLLFFAGAYEGCEEEEEKKDYIEVTVHAFCGITGVDAQGNNLSCGVIDTLLGGMQIRIDVVKAGGENFVAYKSVQNCFTEAVDCKFNLYREQPIEVSAIIQGGVAGYSVTNGYKVLSWEEADAGQYQGRYHWNADVYMFLQRL